MSTVTIRRPQRRRPVFHELRVAAVDRLTDDAVAVTFDVPDELAEDYRFRPGQALTLRRVVGEQDERRSYSICAPVGAPPRVGVREVPGGYFSSWLVHEVRPGDTVARLGGDEFAVVLPSADEQAARAIATRLLEVLELPYVLEGREFGVGASLGIAVYPVHGPDADTLMRHADAAMYAAKRNHFRSSTRYAPNSAISR